MSIPFARGLVSSKWKNMSRIHTVKLQWEYHDPPPLHYRPPWSWCQPRFAHNLDAAPFPADWRDGDSLGTVGQLKKKLDRLPLHEVTDKRAPTARTKTCSYDGNGRRRLLISDHHHLVEYLWTPKMSYTPACQTKRKHCSECCGMYKLPMGTPKSSIHG